MFIVQLFSSLFLITNLTLELIIKCVIIYKQMLKTTSWEQKTEKLRRPEYHAIQDSSKLTHHSLNILKLFYNLLSPYYKSPLVRWQSLSPLWLQNLNNAYTCRIKLLIIPQKNFIHGLWEARGEGRPSRELLRPMRRWVILLCQNYSGAKMHSCSNTHFKFSYILIENDWWGLYYNCSLNQFDSKLWYQRTDIPNVT